MVGVAYDSIPSTRGRLWQAPILPGNYERLIVGQKHLFLIEIGTCRTAPCFVHPGSMAFQHLLTCLFVGLCVHLSIYFLVGQIISATRSAVCVRLTSPIALGPILRRRCLQRTLPPSRYESLLPLANDYQQLFCIFFFFERCVCCLVLRLQCCCSCVISSTDTHAFVFYTCLCVLFCFVFGLQLTHDKRRAMLRRGEKFYLLEATAWRKQDEVHTYIHTRMRTFFSCYCI